MGCEGEGGMSDETFMVNALMVAVSAGAGLGMWFPRAGHALTGVLIVGFGLMRVLP